MKQFFTVWLFILLVGIVFCAIGSILMLLMFEWMINLNWISASILILIITGLCTANYTLVVNNQKGDE